ncbi:MAG: apolipoprotein N-acyltransferase [Verrucomicrobiales bacterium]|nr:apolipoprotein N-acyltransferase [Verrucomicrobiales bacterium]
MDRESLNRAWPWAASLISGILLAFCYPRFDAANLIWLWQTPLLAALWFSKPGKSKTHRWRRGFLLGFIAGLGFFLISLFWLWEMRKVAESFWAGLAAWLALPGYLALYFGAFGAFAATIGRWKPDFDEVEKSGEKSKLNLFGPSLAVLKIAILNGAAWCGLEWMRGVFLTGFSWNGLGVALHETIVLTQIADIIGVTGLSFFIVFVNCIALATATRLFREFRERKRMRPHLDFAAGVGTIMALFLYGLGKINDVPEKTVDIRAAIIQLNTSIEDKFSGDHDTIRDTLFAYRDLTHGYVASGQIDLVIWPETAIPLRFTYQNCQQYFNEMVLPVADFNLITGIEEENFGADPEDEEIFNSAVLMRGSTADYQSHKKVHLVPFGEFIPFRKAPLPVFDWMFGGIVPVDFSAGTSFEPLKMETLAGEEIGIAPLICFEDTMGDLTRKFVRPGPQLLVNVTNDGWFYDSPQSQQHLANAVFRCIETRRPMARAANTGVSAFIDERGSLYDRYSGEIPDNEAERRRNRRIIQDDRTGNTYILGAMSHELKIPAEPPITFYAQHGDLFSKVAGILALAAILFHAGGRLRQRKTK